MLALAADHIIGRRSIRATCRAAVSPPKQAHRHFRSPTNQNQLRLHSSRRAIGDSVYAVKALSKAGCRLLHYVRDGYLWNSGNFLFRAAVLPELKRLEPDIAAAVDAAVANASNDLGFLRLESEAFSRAPQKSIDYAVMERTDLAAVALGNFRWSDIGSWDALFDITSRDPAGNVLQGSVMTMDAKGCIVHSNDRLTAVVGVNDLVVVSTTDAVMVIPRARAQDVRELVSKLKTEKRPEATDHKRAHRPWGYYESIDAGDRFQVKRIVVIPGGVLSLQNRHRAEHWVVVRGRPR